MDPVQALQEAIERTAKVSDTSVEEATERYFAAYPYLRVYVERARGRELASMGRALGRMLEQKRAAELEAVPTYTLLGVLPVHSDGTTNWPAFAAQVLDYSKTEEGS